MTTPSSTTSQSNDTPKDIRVSRERGIMTLVYHDGTEGELSAEYLRISSPSAEVMGHGPGQEVPQIGKRNVLITNIEPVGRYAIRIIFSDSHDTGIFNWPYLRELITNKNEKWSKYISHLNSKNLSRDEH
jgi:DUF971 family protein